MHSPCIPYRITSTTRTSRSIILRSNNTLRPPFSVGQESLFQKISRLVSFVEYAAYATYTNHSHFVLLELAFQFRNSLLLFNNSNIMESILLLMLSLPHSWETPYLVVAQNKYTTSLPTSRTVACRRTSSSLSAIPWSTQTVPLKLLYPRHYLCLQ